MPILLTFDLRLQFMKSAILDKNFTPVFLEALINLSNTMVVLNFADVLKYQIGSKVSLIRCFSDKQNLLALLIYLKRNCPEKLHIINFIMEDFMMQLLK